MKKFLYLIILSNLFFSCQNLNTVKKPKIFKPNILVQDNFILNNSGTKYFLDVIYDNIKNKTSRTYLENTNPEIYLGEYAVIPIETVDFFSMKVPRVQSYDAFIKDGYFYFRSIYQGNYSFSFIKDDIVIKTINISNLSRYIISSNNLENMIYENKNIKDLENLENNVKLFRMLFPENSLNKKFSLILIDLAVERGNKKILKRESEYLENNFELNSLEKLKLLSQKNTLLKENNAISFDLLNFKENSPELNNLVKETILNKKTPNNQELLFLEAYYTKERTFDLANKISDLYFKNNNLVKANYYKPSGFSLLPLPVESTLNELENLNSPKEILEENIKENEEAHNLYVKALKFYKNKSYAEAILALENAKVLSENQRDIEDVDFYLGMSYYNSNNFERAIEKLNLVNEENKNYPEALYRIGDLKYKQKNIEEATNLFEKVKNLYPKTIWGRKSSIYLLKIK